MPCALTLTPTTTLTMAPTLHQVGLKNGLARRFLPSEELQGNAVRDLDRYQVPPCVDARCSAGSRVPTSHAAAGWYHFFHMDDIRAIAPRWYHHLHQP